MIRLEAVLFVCGRDDLSAELLGSLKVCRFRGCLNDLRDQDGFSCFTVCVCVCVVNCGRP